MQFSTDFYDILEAQTKVVTLRNSTVVNFWFDDLHGAIFEKVEDLHFADLEWGRTHLLESLLEERIEAQHLKFCLETGYEKYNNLQIYNKVMCNIVIVDMSKLLRYGKFFESYKLHRFLMLKWGQLNFELFIKLAQMYIMEAHSKNFFTHFVTKQILSSSHNKLPPSDYSIKH